MEKWKLDLLRCDACRGSFRPKASSLECLDCGKSFPVVEGIVSNKTITATAAAELYEEIGGCRLLERSKDPLSTSRYDAMRYADCLGRHLPPPHEAVLDLGCGDGRNSAFLLQRGCRRLTAVDINIDGLLRFQRSLSPSQHGSTLLVHSDLNHLPLARESFSLVVAIEVLLLNEDFRKACGIAAGLLVPDGVLVNSEYDLEGTMLYSLFERDLRGFIEVLQRKRKLEGPSKKMPSRVFEAGEVRSALESLGLSVEAQYGISAFPGLATAALREASPAPDVRQKMIEFIEQLSLEGRPPWRCVCWVSRKRPS